MKLCTNRVLPCLSKFLLRDTQTYTQTLKKNFEKSIFGWSGKSCFRNTERLNFFSTNYMKYCGESK